MIVTAGGENVQPDTIEEAYQKHPAIEEIAVLEHQGKIVGLIVPKVGAQRRRRSDSAQGDRRYIPDAALVSATRRLRVTEAIPAPASASRVGICWRDATSKQCAATARRRRAPRADVAGGDVGR